ncbi:sugar transferase [Ekhidna sp. To15]|uniref:sugar transferase n=1 Tax=Ekhidna sp. To15 TaxID=3395267 RepID=UPI003F51CE67
MRIFKPFCDVIVAIALAIVCLPLFTVLALIVFLDFKGSPVFTQVRIGQNERAFKLFKFRTMRVDGDEKTVSRLGRFLRSTSLDELPQLINVIRTEMSFVGPRPLLPEYLPYYTVEERGRHNRKPGITGWAQVNGRNTIDWGMRMSMDVYYVKKISLWLDLKILVATAILLLKRDRTPYKRERTIKFSEYASKR